VTARRLRAAAPWLIALAALVPYSTALVCGFAFDDHKQILENPHVQSAWPPWRPFTVDLWAGAGEALGVEGGIRSGHYRPVFLLSCAVQLALHGPAPLPFHAVNLTLHLAVCLTLGALLRRLGCEERTALIATLLFAAAPIHTEAVTAIVGRSELLAALGVAAAVFTWLGPLNSPQPPRWGRVVGTAVWVALAQFSKESAIVLPLLVILADLHVGRQPGRNRMIRWAILFVPIALFLAMRWHVFGSPLWRPDTDVLDNPLVVATSTERLLAAPVILLEYVSLSLFPLTLSADHSLNSFPLVPVPMVPLATSAAVVAVIALVAWVAPGWRRALGFGAVAMGLTCALLLNWPLLSTVTFADRLFYLPSLFVYLLVGAALAALSRRQAPAALGVVIAVVALFGARTALRNLDWRSDLRLWEATVLAVPNSARAQANYAAQLLIYADAAEARGEPQRTVDARAAAANALGRALEIYPEYHLCRVLQAQLAASAGDWAEAARLLEVAKPHVPFPPELEELEAEIRSHLP
jgi:hypothetical protein